MNRSRSVVPFFVLLALSGAWVAPAQVIAPVPPSPAVLPPPRLGLIDSRATQIEVIPGVPLAGLEVLGVVPGSPAARAGLAPGDVVLSANAARIIVPDDLRRALAESRGLLRMKVFEGRTEQVLNRDVFLGPGPSGGSPLVISVTGRLKLGVMAIGGETTGMTLTTPDGQIYELDFGRARPPDRDADGRDAIVSGLLTTRRGPERRNRQIIKVSGFRIIGGARPRSSGDTPKQPF
jgi:membrane-associated protease RseP (regulator of RpoE activity)